mmetsp:Transcript_8255/g.22396  ORF Transcript_8255/g.22396 Transcript_8255/m.22396 type:complete len:81 (-) Transcript_8255:234-476(-)
MDNSSSKHHPLPNNITHGAERRGSAPHSSAAVATPSSVLNDPGRRHAEKRLSHLQLLTNASAIMVRRHHYATQCTTRHGS